MVSKSENNDTFVESLLNYIGNESLIEHGETVIAAFSGGIDSAVLLHALLQVSRELGIRIVPAYFNHELRGEESEEEEEFIINIVREYGLEPKIGRGNVKKNAIEGKMSVQVSARQLRYQFLDETAAKYSAQKIATAHHYNDQIETVLMRFLQGASYKGLRGIPVKRGKYIRPILWAHRSKIEHYAKLHAVPHFEDSSNIKTTYLRNRIRHEILPYLEEKLAVNFDTVLSRHAERFRDISEMIDSLSAEALKDSLILGEKDKIILDIQKFRNYFTLLKQNVLFACFDIFKGIKHSEYNSLANRIIEFSDATKTRRHEYIGIDIFVERQNGGLHICRDKCGDFVEKIELGIENSFEDECGGRFCLTSEILKEARIQQFLQQLLTKDVVKDNDWDEIIDRQALAEPLSLRYWRKGDSFIPLGMTQKKKLSDFFSDLKVPLDERKRVFILTDREKIVWVCGYRIDERVRVTGKTKKMVGLKIFNL